MVEKYNACLGNQRARFELLKAYMLDENMSLGSMRLSSLA